MYRLYLNGTNFSTGDKEKGHFLFLFQDPIQIPKWHLAVIPPLLSPTPQPQSVTVLQSFVFYDPDNF